MKYTYVILFVLTYEIRFVGQNVRFLAQFITEAGIIIKRKQVILDVSWFGFYYACDEVLLVQRE